MGTRNLTMVVLNGETKVAQYGQWDGYPSGQGATILTFLKQTNLASFKEALSRCQWVDDEKQKEIDAFYKSIGVHDSWVTMEESKQINAKYPLFSRDNGAGVLQMIMDQPAGAPIYLYDNSDFIQDTLFCEWAYKIDLDTMTLTVYDSGNIVRELDINNLPSVDEFVESFKHDEE